jgi:hypothetical protein
MQTQANISADQNKISTSVQRAFVTVSTFDMPVRFGTGFAKDRKYWWFIPNIKNSGNTPTKNMRYFIAATCPPELDIIIGGYMGLSCNFMGPPQPEDPEVLMNDQTFKGKTHAALLGPQSVLPLGGVGVTEGSIQRIKDGSRIFEEGIVYYNDIFPGSDLHTTKFCFQLTASISDKNEIQTSYGQCAHWNCADEECKTDREEYDKQVASGEIKPPAWTPPPGAMKFETPIPAVPTPDQK